VSELNSLEDNKLIAQLLGSKEHMGHQDKTSISNNAYIHVFCRMGEDLELAT
jgi:hypothetical protein